MDGLASEGAVPEAKAVGDLHRAADAVAGHGLRGPGEGGGEPGEVIQLLAPGPGTATPAGVGRGELVEGGVLAKPGRPGDAPGQGPEVTAGVGGVGADVERVLGEAVGHEQHQTAGDHHLGATLPERAEQGQADRPGAEGQINQDAEDQEAGAEADRSGAGGGAVVGPASPEDTTAATAEERVVNDQLQRNAGGHQGADDEVGASWRPRRSDDQRR